MDHIVEEIALISPITRTSNEQCFNSNNNQSNQTDQITIDIKNSKINFKENLLLIILVVCLFLIVGPLSLTINFRSPSIKDRHVDVSIFSEERAYDYLTNLTSYGSRVSHTIGNVNARKYLLMIIEKICSTNRQNLRCEIDLQNFSNSYYDHLENIVVRVSNSQIDSSNLSSLLLTAHYDTVEFSSGSSDDGSGIVIILELLSNIINDQSISFSQMNLIILFTDGEEIGSEGVLTFLNTHHWSLNIIRFIYLDAITCREKASLIQIKSSQLIKDYSLISRPSANLILEYIPQLIGTTSDYDVYHLISSLNGYNIGSFLDGYTYHTYLDRKEFLKQGVLQELGENLHELIRLIFSKTNEELNLLNDNDQLIYFDFFGRYLIYYKLSISKSIQIGLIIFILLINMILILIDNQFNHQLCRNPYCIYKSLEKSFLFRLITIFIYFSLNLISILLSYLFSLLFSWLLSLIRPYSYYGNSTLAIFLFSLIFQLFFMIFFYLSKKFHEILVKQWSKQSTIMSKVSFNYEMNLSILLIYILLMFISILSNSRLFYLVLIWSIFLCPTNVCLIIIEFLIDWQRIKLFEKLKYWLYSPIIISIIPLIHSIEILNRLIRILIPFMLRGFRLKRIFNENQIICSLICIPNVFFILIFLPLIYRTKQTVRLIIILLISLIIILVILFIRKPFTNEHPKIFYAKHTSKSIYTVLKLSNNTYLVPSVSQTSIITLMTFDNLPLKFILDDFEKRSGLKLLNRKCLNKNKCIFNDSFNRTLPMKTIRIEKGNDTFHLNIQFEHVLSSNIYVSSYSSMKYSIENSQIFSRNQTNLSIRFDSKMNLFDVNIDIKTCQFSDSPFLVLFNDYMSYMLLTGDSHCHAFNDLTTLAIDTKYI